MSVEISETLFFELVDLLREPKTINPASKECVLRLNKRNELLDHLLVIRRNLLGLDHPIISSQNATPAPINVPPKI